MVNDGIIKQIYNSEIGKLLGDMINTQVFVSKQQKRCFENWTMALKVVVIGGGISGMIIANALQDLDIDLVIYDQKEELMKHGYQMNIDQNGAYCLAKLSFALYHDIYKKHFGNKLVKCSYIDNYGKTLCEIPMRLKDENKDCSSISQYETRSFFANELYEIMMDNIKEKTKVILNKKVIKIEGDKSNISTLHFEDGSTDTANIVIMANCNYSSIFKDLSKPESTNMCFISGWCNVKFDTHAKYPGVVLLKQYFKRKILPIFLTPKSQIMLYFGGKSKVSFLITASKQEMSKRLNGKSSSKDILSLVIDLISCIDNPAIHYLVKYGFWNERLNELDLKNRKIKLKKQREKKSKTFAIDDLSSDSDDDRYDKFGATTTYPLIHDIFEMNVPSIKEHKNICFISSKLYPRFGFDISCILEDALGLKQLLKSSNKNTDICNLLKTFNEKRYCRLKDINNICKEYWFPATRLQYIIKKWLLYLTPLPRIFKQQNKMLKNLINDTNCNVTSFEVDWTPFIVVVSIFITIVMGIIIGLYHALS